MWPASPQLAFVVIAREAKQSRSRRLCDDVEEMVMCFTHSIAMEWILPGVRATGRRAEFVLVGIIQFQDSKVAHEHLYWDQATLLSQIGVLDHPLAAAGVGSAGQLLKLHDLRKGRIGSTAAVLGEAR
jgi:hypothetical protein